MEAEFSHSTLQLVFLDDFRKTVGGVKVDNLPGLEALQQPGLSHVFLLIIVYFFWVTGVSCL
jgi:hypothetical protein